MPEHRNRFSFIRSRLWWGVSVAIAVLAVTSLGREWYQNYSTRREIQALEAQARTLEGRRRELIALTQKFENGDYLEREARLDFGLQRPGESVVVVRSDTDPTSTNTPPKPTSNPGRWWQYFLHGSTR